MRHKGNSSLRHKHTYTHNIAPYVRIKFHSNKHRRATSCSIHEKKTLKINNLNHKFSYLEYIFSFPEQIYVNTTLHSQRQTGRPVAIGIFNLYFIFWSVCLCNVSIEWSKKNRIGTLVCKFKKRIEASERWVIVLFSQALAYMYLVYEIRWNVIWNYGNGHSIQRIQRWKFIFNEHSTSTSTYTYTKYEFMQIYCSSWSAFGSSGGHRPI